MNKLEVVEKYFNILSSDGDLLELRNIFTESMQFIGPMFQFNFVEDYIESLVSDPPIGFSFKIIDMFEKENKIVVIYDFSKGEICTPMAQYFEFDGDLISKILLIFDSSVFT